MQLKNHLKNHWKKYAGAALIAGAGAGIYKTMGVGDIPKIKKMPKVPKIKPKIKKPKVNPKITTMDELRKRSGEIKEKTIGEKITAESKTHKKVSSKPVNIVKDRLSTLDKIFAAEPKPKVNPKIITMDELRKRSGEIKEKTIGEKIFNAQPEHIEIPKVTIPKKPTKTITRKVGTKNIPKSIAAMAVATRLGYNPDVNNSKYSNKLPPKEK